MSTARNNHKVRLAKQEQAEKNSDPLCREISIILKHYGVDTNEI
jgi:hypothetical protein